MGITSLGLVEARRLSGGEPKTVLGMMTACFGLGQMLGPDHPEVALQMKLMANSYKAHGEWQKSEFCFCRAMSFDHKFFGNTTIHLALAYNYLAELNRSKGDLLHAQSLYQKAAQLTEKLAQQPNGAERMCKIMNEYLTACIDIVNEHGPRSLAARTRRPCR